MAHVALLAGVLAGCAEGADEEDKASAKTSTGASATAAAGGTRAVAPSGGRIGAEGSACELPVSFDIAQGWKAEAVDAEAASGDLDDEVAAEVADALLHQGPVTAACEVDAKPAGYFGYLRVWTGEPGEDSARTVLEGFVAAEKQASKATYSTFRTGDLVGAEVEYLYTSELLDETKKEHALAVTTPEGPVVLHLGGMDTEEHEAMLPALELAERTLRVG
ncbi:lipoprotein [Streptomyces sp. NPDC005574]|uniref:lipoprotein n=1 Tax=Streptomyces sp. NPDC005574 TaxID=3156891 RepID=UPI0033B5DD52